MPAVPSAQNPHASRRSAAESRSVSPDSTYRDCRTASLPATRWSPPASITSPLDTRQVPPLLCSTGPEDSNGEVATWQWHFNGAAVATGSRPAKPPTYFGHRRRVFSTALWTWLSPPDVYSLVLGVCLGVLIMSSVGLDWQSGTGVSEVATSTLGNGSSRVEQTRTQSRPGGGVGRIAPLWPSAGDPPQEQPGGVVAKFPHRMYVGVLSAKHFISTRVTAVHNAWAKEFVPHVQFYIGRPLGALDDEIADLQAQFKKDVGVDVVHLEGASEHEYPPQRKMFLMMKSMCQQLGRYQWFFRADDDVYVRRSKLLGWLQHLDPFQPHYIGSFGFGREDVKTRLGLEKPFCMGGPGVIMSHATMEKVCPHIDQCMEEVVTGEEDTELGRCVYKHAGIGCTLAYEFWSLFRHAYPQEYRSLPQPYMQELEHLRDKPLTVHHLKEPHLMFRLRSFYAGSAATDTTARVGRLQHALAYETSRMPPRVTAVLRPPERRRQAGGQSARAGAAPGQEAGMPSAARTASPNTTKGLTLFEAIDTRATAAAARAVRYDVEPQQYVAQLMRSHVETTMQQSGRPSSAHWSANLTAGRWKLIMTFDDLASSTASRLETEMTIGRRSEVLSRTRYRDLPALHFIVLCSARSSGTIRRLRQLLTESSLRANLVFSSCKGQVRPSDAALRSWPGDQVDSLNAFQGRRGSTELHVFTLRRALEALAKHVKTDAHGGDLVVVAEGLDLPAPLTKAHLANCYLMAQDAAAHQSFVYRRDWNASRPRLDMSAGLTCMQLRAAMHLLELPQHRRSRLFTEDGLWAALSREVLAKYLRGKISRAADIKV